MSHGLIRHGRVLFQMGSKKRCFSWWRISKSLLDDELWAIIRNPFNKYSLEIAKSDMNALTRKQEKSIKVLCNKHMPLPHIDWPKQGKMKAEGHISSWNDTQIRSSCLNNFYRGAQCGHGINKTTTSSRINIEPLWCIGEGVWLQIFTPLLAWVRIQFETHFFVVANVVIGFVYLWGFFFH